MSTNDQDPKKPETTASPERDDARRRLLKTLAAGGVASAALPTQWTKPVIEAVVLPAHAQATHGAVVGGGGGSSPGGPSPAGSIGESILDFFVSPAGAPPVPLIGNVCIEIKVDYLTSTTTKVQVTRICINCGKSGLYQVFSGSQGLTGSGSGPWTGNVSTTAGSLSVSLSIVNLFTGTLATGTVAGIPVALLLGGTCSCASATCVD